MLFNYQEFLDGIDRKAYHEGEWQWEEDGYTVTRTYTYSAPGCHTSCGVLMYTKDGKLEKIEGDPLDPCANGRLCMRCLNLEEGVNYEDRPKYPLKRAGKRGENKWERITWDEALDTIADWIHTNIDEAGFGRESIFVNHGTGRNISSWVPFLGGACLGTPNIGAIGSSGYSCYLPRTCGTAASIGDFPIVDASEGHEDRYVNGEWVRPDVVVVWGCEPLKSNADGYLGHWLVACMQQGTEFVCIDPQLTWIAAHAMYWLPLRPATDMAVALSWLNVITQEDLHDADFVDKWCAYYDDLKDYVAQFTPEWASEVTGLDPRPHPRVRTLLRQGRARRHPVGPGLRHAERLHPAVPDGERHHERVRQHRQAGHEPAGAQRLRHQSRLRHGPAVLPAGDVRQEAHGGRGASRLRALHRHGRLRRREPGLRDGQALSHEDVLVAGRQRHHLHGQRRAAHLPDAGERGVLRGGRPVPHAHGRRLRRHLPAPEDHRRARLHARVVDAAARHEVGQPVVRGEVRRGAASWLWATR